LHIAKNKGAALAASFFATDFLATEGTKNTKVTTDFAHRRERRKRRGVLASLVFSANSAFKASFVAELCLRPQGQLRCPSAILPWLAKTKGLLFSRRAKSFLYR
jgi:hypothetical protein